jgi:hypothetical protein
MAFGGVATGSMKAYEHVTVAGSMRYNGFIPIAIDCMGKNRVNLFLFFKIQYCNYFLNYRFR